MSTGLAERLRFLRERAGLTRTALAEPRYTVSYVSQIEAGRRNPSASAITYFAERLGTSAHYLATGVPEGAEAEIAYELERARVALREGSAEDALGLARCERDRAAGFGLQALHARARVIEANSLFLLGRYREAIDAYEEALEEDLLDQREQGLTTNALAATYRIVGDLGYAADLIETYLRTRGEQPLDAAVLGQLNSTLVSIYFERGDIMRAEQASARAVASTEEGVTPDVRANALWSASRILAERSQWEEALEFATRARIIVEEMGDRRRTVGVHNASAFLCLEADPPRLDEADEHLRIAESLVDEHSAPEDVAYLYAERARLALMRDRPRDALDYSTRAVDLSGADELERGRCLFLQGRAFALLSQHADAVGCFREGAAVFHKRGARQQEAACWRELGEAQLESGDTAAAIESLRAGLAALDPKRSRA